MPPWKGGRQVLEPKEVGRLAADLRALGFDPVVHGHPGGAWEVAIEGEHVRATADYVFRNGRTRRMAGTMTIDGEPAPLAEDYDDLRRIWDEHEGGAVPAADPAPAVLMEISEPADGGLPAAVQFAKDSLERASGGELEVRTGMSGEHWVIGVDLPDGDGLRIVFSRYRRLWDMDRRQPLQVLIDGEDRSAEAGGDMNKAMALLLEGTAPPPGEAPPGSGPVRSRQPSHRDMGVETRRRVVIRELKTG
jgi:hypothetical protein